MCSAARIPPPDIPGLQILSLTATNKQNYSFPGNPLLDISDDTYVNMNFCNVSVTYTHPGWNDEIHVTVYLPVEGWNGRFQATGGGGFVTGGESLAIFYMVPGLQDGYAVATTDGGHSDDLLTAATGAGDWALASPGNVNWPLLLDFAYVALHDMANIGKAVTSAYFGTPPHHSYFHGGSTGGRQGMMLAQRYPKDFDGVVSICPAMNWAQFILASYWPQFVMNQIGAYPEGCELDAITKAAIAACDGLDGVEDGIISLPGLCEFSAHSLVGKAFNCNGRPSIFTSAGATVAEAAWTGPRSSTGEWQWFGVAKDAELGVNGIGIASTVCEDGECRGAPFTIPVSWIRHFIKRDPEFDVSSMSHADWDSVVHASRNEYDSVIGTADPDLSEFRKSGAKLLSWHGLRDELIPVNGSIRYYDQVMEQDPAVHDYFRLFLVPGAGHSWIEGPTPKNMMEVIVSWVEEGIVPDTLRGIGKDGRDTMVERDLCMYPQVQIYESGDPTVATSFKCAK
ncbi:feruloyl esterase B precursor [Aspergillus pseudoustus]|uniref:Carboxylic ester hydrolase n=1 Tax=Aspergillus pseudoustus TaxID=1810923 RepID=A0ABR4JJI5_9EURO